MALHRQTLVQVTVGEAFGDARGVADRLDRLAGHDPGDEHQDAHHEGRTEGERPLEEGQRLLLGRERVEEVELVGPDRGDLDLGAHEHSGVHGRARVGRVPRDRDRLELATVALEDRVAQLVRDQARQLVVGADVVEA
ncbi:hypothetical protein D3C74_392210 [compost metagenome]